MRTQVVALPPEWKPHEKLGVYSVAMPSRKDRLYTFLESVGFVGDNIHVFDAIVPGMETNMRSYMHNTHIHICLFSHSHAKVHICVLKNR